MPAAPIIDGKISFEHLVPSEETMARILNALAAQAKRLAVPSRAYHNDRLGPFLEERELRSGQQVLGLAFDGG